MRAQAKPRRSVSWARVVIAVALVFAALELERFSAPKPPHRGTMTLNRYEEPEWLRSAGLGRACRARALHREVEFIEKVRLHEESLLHRVRAAVYRIKPTAASREAALWSDACGALAMSRFDGLSPHGLMRAARETRPHSPRTADQLVDALFHGKIHRELADEILAYAGDEHQREDYERRLAARAHPPLHK